MNRLTYTSIGVAALLGFSFTAQAAGVSSVGSSGANELRIPIGAQGTALMGSNIGDVHGVGAITWNVGGLVDVESNEATFGSYDYFADMKMTHFAAAHNFGNLGVIGLSARLLNLGELVVTTESQPNGTGEILEPKFSVFTFSWARSITDRVALGFNANLINEKVKDMEASGASFDFGVQVETPMEGLSFGIAIRNFGANMVFEGYGNESRFIPEDQEPNSYRQTWNLKMQDFQLPASFHFGLAYDILMDPMNQLTGYAAFNGNNTSSDEYVAGLEYGFRNMAFARFGYVYASKIDDDQEYLYTWSGGLGFRFDMGATDLYLDWSYTENEFFDGTTWYTLRFAF